MRPFTRSQLGGNDIRIVFVCLNYDEEHSNLQPAKYFDRIAREASCRGHLVSIIGGTRKDLRLFRIGSTPSGVNVEVCEPPCNEHSLESLMIHERPDAVVFSVGPVRRFDKSVLLNVDCVAVGVLSYPIYSLRNVLGVGPLTLAEEFLQIYAHAVGALLRKRNLNWTSRTFDVVIVESKRNLAIVRETRPQHREVFYIPPGVDREFLDASRKEGACKRHRWRFIYIGSAAPLRGARDVLRAFREVKKHYERSELRLLLRPDKISTRAQKKLLREARNVAGVHVSIDPLSKEQLIEEMLASSIAVFPFRLVQSDMPVGPLEASSCGCRVIVSDVDGLMDFAGPADRIVKKVNCESLVMAMIESLTEGGDCSPIMPHSASSLPPWEVVTDELLRILHKEVVRRNESRQTEECT